jgi:hypothetical protein
MDEDLRSSIETILDSFEHAVDRRVCTEIDAGACGTEYDRRKAHEAADKYWDTREESLKNLIALVKAHKL